MGRARGQSLHQAINTEATSTERLRQRRRLAATSRSKDPEDRDGDCHGVNRRQQRERRNGQIRRHGEQINAARSSENRQQPGGLMEKRLRDARAPNAGAGSRIRNGTPGKPASTTAASQYEGEKSGQRQIDGELHVLHNVAARE